MVPSLFICHGSPTIALENTFYTEVLEELGQKIRPKAIVVFSAHYESDEIFISSIEGTYDMIYDFGGFPDELFSIIYPAKGSAEIAGEVQKKLEDRGFKTRLDESRGLDHGSWVVLKLMYPEADIPVVLVSVNLKFTLEEQFRIGEALNELGREDILVIGSGATVHNLYLLDWKSEKIEDWAFEFDDWLIDKIKNKDMEALYNFRKLAPHANKAIPREEHIIPLFIAMGSGQKENFPELIYRGYEYGNLSYICFKF